MRFLKKTMNSRNRHKLRISTGVVTFICKYSCSGDREHFFAFYMLESLDSTRIRVSQDRLKSVPMAEIARVFLFFLASNHTNIVPGFGSLIINFL